MYVCAGASDVNDVLSTLVCVTDWPISIFFLFIYFFNEDDNIPASSQISQQRNPKRNDQLINFNLHISTYMHTSRSQDIESSPGTPESETYIHLHVRTMSIVNLPYSLNSKVSLDPWIEKSES